jgi:predicted Zn-dependent protease
MMAGCLLPSTANAQFKPSREEQIKVGRGAAQDVVKKYKVLPETDPRVKLLRELSKKLLAVPPEGKDSFWRSDKFPYEFNVIDSNEVNAFAVPGGPIFFFTGLIDRMTTVDELAGVLAHEINHVRREHWARAYNDEIKKQLGLAVLLGLTNANRELSTLALTASDLYGLKFSRGHETESDDWGLKLVVGAGFNPEGMVDVFEMFRKLKGSGAPPEWQSTHPDDRNRIRRLQDKIAKYKKAWPDKQPLPFMTPAMKAEANPPKSGSGTSTGTGGKPGARSSSR